MSVVVAASGGDRYATVVRRCRVRRYTLAVQERCRPRTTLNAEMLYNGRNMESNVSPSTIEPKSRGLQTPKPFAGCDVPPPI